MRFVSSRQQQNRLCSLLYASYYCKVYSIHKQCQRIVGYENTDAADLYGPVDFGGIAGKGKLSVTIPTYILPDRDSPPNRSRLGYQGQTAGLDPAKACQIDSIVPEGLRAKAFPGCQVLVAKTDRSFTTSRSVIIPTTTCSL